MCVIDVFVRRYELFELYINFPYGPHFCSVPYTYITSSVYTQHIHVKVRNWIVLNRCQFHREIRLGFVSGPNQYCYMYVF